MTTEKNNRTKKTYEELEEYTQQLEEKLKGSQNREYKSRLFSFLFGREENKHWTLSLYNAIHGTDHDDLSSITINTIEDVVYMGMKNDLSILVSETLSFYSSLEIYEQQSSYNPNIPIREFMYAGKLYDKYIHSAKLNRYGKALLPLPLPKLIVFYNGENEKEDEIILCLSDAFKKEIQQNIENRNAENNKVLNDTKLTEETERIFLQASPDIEVKVRMININHGHNRKILTACRPLEEYAWFVERVRQKHTAKKTRDSEPVEIGTAIDMAIDEMPEDFIIKKFILSNRAEVKDMCLTEYNETETMEMLRQEGRQEGRQETKLLDLRNLMDSTGWNADQAMDMLRIPTNQRAALYVDLNEKV